MEGEGKHSEGKSRRGRERGDVTGGGAAFLSRLPTNRVFNNNPNLASIHLLQIAGWRTWRSVTLMYYNSVQARRAELYLSAFQSARRSPARLEWLILISWQFLSADQSAWLTGSQRGATPCCRWLSALIMGRLRALFPHRHHRFTYSLKLRKCWMIAHCQGAFKRWRCELLQQLTRHCKHCGSNFRSRLQLQVILLCV